MKAVVNSEYGPPSVLSLAEVPTPAPADGEVLVRVVATGVNPGDWDLLHGRPYVIRLATGLRRPRDRILGLAIAGRVESVGSRVSELRIGDEVYAGIAKGGFAEFVVVSPAALAPKPANLTFAQAAAVPISAVTALQALRDVGRVRPGHRVLINGASGGVGTYAVQIARNLGAEVTGVCSTASVDLVRSLGATHVIDYSRDDFTRNGLPYDLILDNVGNRSLSELRRAVTRNGTLIPNSNKGTGRWLGSFLRRAIHARLVSPFVRQRLRPFASADRREDLVALNGMIESGSITPVIDRTFPLAEVADALAYYGEGHVHGKVVITVGPDETRERGS